MAPQHRLAVVTFGKPEIEALENRKLSWASASGTKNRGGTAAYRRGQGD
jgi:hypothetical protein